MHVRNLEEEHNYMLTLFSKTEKRWEIEQINPANYRRWERIHKGQILWECGERVRNCLFRAGIRSDYEMLQQTPSQLLKLTNFGQKSLNLVIEIYGFYGYQLAEDANDCKCNCHD